MASSNPVSPPMSHSAAYYDNRSSVRPLSHNHHYSPTLLHPQAAHLNPNPRSPTTPQRTEPRRVGGSVSSDESGSSTASETERYLHNKQYQYSPQVERGTWKEPVRHSYQPSQIGANLDRGSHTRSELVEDNSTVFRYIQPEASEEAKENDHAFWILIWLSFLDPLHCIFSALYSIFALFTIILLLPLRLCRRECSPTITLVRMVGPLFRNHLQMIFAKSLDHAHTFEFSPACLVLIHLVSPIISLGNAIAAWIVAVFWLFAIIMGNPDGTEKRDDGRATVLMLRDWWEKCLLSAVRK
ncbi:hypothetical protein PV05_02704 [Exophiala xenobiotica]|uniref:Uncharacterized protein n=1 Tax=Exophiala xenobiotica TaxID=348802 RepID=A0A0D2D754_9EURO|nr:uncharacterized protein PV05_02704 [Exophiala xenobiotica]KIW58157.1 hypothetical protein PV05_02704 [Exophiala xenobiotica]